MAGKPRRNDRSPYGRAPWKERTAPQIGTDKLTGDPEEGTPRVSLNRRRPVILWSEERAQEALASSRTTWCCPACGSWNGPVGVGTTWNHPPATTCGRCGAPRPAE